MIERNDELDKANIELAKVRKQVIEQELKQDLYRFEHDELRMDNFRDAYDIENRIYNFLGPVGQESASKCAEYATAWARQGVKLDQPITIRLTSPGGELRAGLMLYEILAHIADDMPVRTVALGSADSMASLLLQAGTTRIIGRHSSMTLHEIQIQQGIAALFTQESLDERQRQDEMLKRLNDRLVKILLSKTNGKLPEAVLRRNIKGKEWLVQPEDAVKYGLVDGIGWK